MIKVTFTALAFVAGLASTAAQARTVDVEITNLTNGTYFTPLLVAAHSRDTHLFEVGAGASPSLQAMAEGGDLTGLIDEVESAGGSYVANPADGLLEPGESTSARLKVRGRHRSFLSITGMLLPTNDGFVGVDALPIPRWRGVYTYYLNGYDAGTEANDELITGGGAPGAPGIPADPGGDNGISGTGAAGADRNGKVHIHRGVLGDDNPTGGASDLDSSIHRWQNPVAKLVIRVR